jgi:UDP-N-acetylglucosamine--N-acetylmuramyl-(pentapeptide) pyrophosphoryl-undecaprenol N-acetylglucosamine transferase
MKIVFTGNPKADHFYTMIAVSEKINEIIDRENLADTHLYYLSTKPFSKKDLYENGIIFKEIGASKSNNLIANIVNIFISIINLFNIFPDIVFSTGGYASYPILVAAKILKIPVIIHESNSIPNKINKWAGKFAKNVTVSYKQEIDFFEKEKIIHTGQPIRHNLKNPTKTGAYEFLNLEKNIPIIWIIGGSYGAKNLNRVIEEALPNLLKKYQIIHQVGYDDFKDMKMLTDATLISNEFKYRYHPVDFLNQLSMKMMAGVADVVISRAGLSLFEIAYWGIPSIIVPITKSYGNHQIKNAYNYAREGACVVIEENNLTDQGLIFEINRIYDNEDVKNKMKEGAKKFSIPNADKKIAEEIIKIVLEHEE